MKASARRRVIFEGIMGSGKSTSTRCDGLSSLYVEYRALTDRLFAQLPLDKLAIENSAQEWQLYYARIEEALGF